MNLGLEPSLEMQARGPAKADQVWKTLRDEGLTARVKAAGSEDQGGAQQVEFVPAQSPGSVSLRLNALFPDEVV